MSKLGILIEHLRSGGESLSEGGYAITGSGLRKPKTIKLLPNHEYYMGASSSPKHVIVTRVSGDRVSYFMHPYTKEISEQRWVAEDLIASGTASFLKSRRSSYFPALSKALHAALRGSDKQGPKVDYRDHQKVVVVAAMRNPHPERDVDTGAKISTNSKGEDLWYRAERYGSVGMLGGDFEITMPRGEVKELKKDMEFKVLSVSDRR